MKDMPESTSDPEAVKAVAELETALKGLDVGEGGISPVDARALRTRIDIRDATKKEVPTLQDAEQIMGTEGYIGPQQVKKVWGVDVKEIPPIPFTREELERAKELGQFLILRVDDLGKGAKSTMKAMYKRMTNKFADEDRGKVLYNNSWYKDERFFIGDTVRFAWALQSRSVLPSSTSKGYLEQTELRAAYLRDEVFRGQELPEEYKTALAELDAKKKEIQDLLRKNNNIGANRRLADLKINQLLSRHPAETIYDSITYYLATNKRILPGVFERSPCLSLVGAIVHVGCCDKGGVRISASRPGRARPYIGVSFSRQS